MTEIRTLLCFTIKAHLSCCLRVLEYDTESRELTVVMDNLRFPNGIHLLPDEESVLVAETTMARIRRYHTRLT